MKKIILIALLTAAVICSCVACSSGPAYIKNLSDDITSNDKDRIDQAINEIRTSLSKNSSAIISDDQENEIKVIMENIKNVPQCKKVFLDMLSDPNQKASYISTSFKYLELNNLDDEIMNAILSSNYSGNLRSYLNDNTILNNNMLKQAYESYKIIDFFTPDINANITREDVPEEYSSRWFVSKVNNLGKIIIFSNEGKGLSLNYLTFELPKEHRISINDIEGADTVIFANSLVNELESYYNNNASAFVYTMELEIFDAKSGTFIGVVDVFGGDPPLGFSTSNGGEGSEPTDEEIIKILVSHIIDKTVSTGAYTPSAVMAVNSTGTSSFLIDKDNNLWGCGMFSKGIPGFQFLLDDVNSMQGNVAKKNDGSLWCFNLELYPELSYQQLMLPVKMEDGIMAVIGRYQLNQDGSLWDSKLSNKVMDGIKSFTYGGFSDVVTALKEDGSLWVMYDDNTQPIKVLDGVIEMDIGGTGYQNAYILALKEDGTLWGIRVSGKSIETPDNVMSDVKAVDIGTPEWGGAYYSFALKKDGSLWAWGGNQWGQLGDGTEEDRSEPVKVMEGVQDLSAGNDHSIALKEDGSVWVWGCNENGQFGTQSDNNSSEPVKIIPVTVS